MLYKNKEVKNFKAVVWEDNEKSKKDVEWTFPEEVADGLIQFQAGIYYSDGDANNTQCVTTIKAHRYYKCILLHPYRLMSDSNPNWGHFYEETEVHWMDTIVSWELNTGERVLEIMPWRLFKLFMQEQDESQSKTT